MSCGRSGVEVPAGAGCCGSHEMLHPEEEEVSFHDSRAAPSDPSDQGLVPQSSGFQIPGQPATSTVQAFALSNQQLLSLSPEWILLCCMSELPQ